MMEKIAVKIADRLASAQIISKDDKEAYAYGAELALLKISFFTAILVLALLTNSLFIGLIFTASYLLLRQYSGGFHCKTPIGCLAVSIIIYISMVVVYRGDIALIKRGLLIISALSAAVNVFWTPSESENNPLTNDERKSYRLKAAVISIVYLAAVITAYVYKADALFYALSWSLAADAALIILNLTGGKNHEKNTA